MQDDAATIEAEERIAIMIHDGGLSETEALRLIRGDQQQNLFDLPPRRDR